MIYEHRIYTVIPGREEAFIDIVTEWFPLAEKYGVKVIDGIFQTIFGDRNEVSYILGYDNLAHRERVFESIMEDEDMKKMFEKAQEDPFTYNCFNKILSSTEYSAPK